MSKKLLAAALMSVAVLASGCGGEAQIGYIDGERVMDTPQIKAVLDEGENKILEVQNQAETELSGREDLTDEEMQKAQLELQRKLIGLQQAYSTQVKTKLDTAIADVIKDKNIDVVIDSSEAQQTIFMGGIDITDDLVQKLQ